MRGAGKAALIAELAGKYSEFAFWQPEPRFRLAFSRLFIIEKSGIVAHKQMLALPFVGASFHLWSMTLLRRSVFSTVSLRK
ncbi:hypothetical protein SAMN05216316_2454 [Nitrosovibrio sp. Nv6]|nr:hypothetical protein SAMN05216316_2454 [Nitrosovibrio sp. Nv6]